MSKSGVRQGFLKKYGGFLFKQWKEKYVVLTLEGNLMVCKDADSPPEQMLVLQNNCRSIVEGKEILDLPRLPPGGRRDCCFALILPQDKFLLLLSENPDDCSQWLGLIKKVKEDVSSALGLKQQQRIAPCITDRTSQPDPRSENGPQFPTFSGHPITPQCVRTRESSIRSKGSTRQQQNHGLESISPHRFNHCLRHGNNSDARAVRAVCLLMGGAAASSALGYLSSCPDSLSATTPAPEITHAMGFSDLAGGTSYHHPCSEVVNSSHFNSFDFEGDSDFDAFDCGFTF